ncbi:hypothetical protein TNIN_363091 [Trichonephila inaurata madagascariensis]|uniref:Uncharacterized protein n=1 Tax=Trichonephila inaurata madagascariensis TaxID=2747483 RepID=A0A8X7C067_9ARAC|nr:hypothetical protein TNIN_363091 [Trichonephila inaurata madagascariensis]
MLTQYLINTIVTLVLQKRKYGKLLHTYLFYKLHILDFSEIHVDCKDFICGIDKVYEIQANGLSLYIYIWNTLSVPFAKIFFLPVILSEKQQNFSKECYWSHISTFATTSDSCCIVSDQDTLIRKG